MRNIRKLSMLLKEANNDREEDIRDRTVEQVWYKE